jgi:hypothetical protein
MVAAIAALCLAYAALASYTRPFTTGADAVTAIPLAATVVAMAVRIRATRRSDVVVQSSGESERTPALGRWALGWVIMTVVVGCWELYCYTSAPRSEHPTLSTLIDLLESTRVGKTAAFALWLALGCYLVLQ